MKAAPAIVAAGATIFALLGCRASMSASADANVSGEGTRADAETDGSAALVGDSELSSSSNGSLLVGQGAELSASRVLLGARHDLKLSAGKATASCECLAVALGDSRTAGMMWTSTPPELDDSTQLAIALSSEGVPCEGEPQGSLGASYWGYRLSGNDVVVLVEAARGGRPLTSGAIIPRPVGTGQVLLAPASKQTPYGRPLNGKGTCQVGNPGRARSGGFTELEVGVDAPAQTGTSGADDPMTIDMR